MKNKKTSKTKKTLIPFAAASVLFGLGGAKVEAAPTPSAPAFQFTALGSGEEIRSHLLSSAQNGILLAAEDKAAEGKCGEGKCGENDDKKAKGKEKKAAKEKSGDKNAKKSTTKNDKTTEGKCGEGKCG